MAVLKNAEFKRANLTDANLKVADLTGAALKRAILSGTKTEGIQGLKARQLEDARGDEKTR
ncbi:MAG: pentapeptide repeat-containing protein [Alphaproteobacteria bacterium]|nr:pentapeptide repeat-containing protein [Alphaproteobacteria bacterium]